MAPTGQTRRQRWQPTPGVLLVVEPDGSCRIAFATGFGAGGVFAQQTACRLFVEEKIEVFHSRLDESLLGYKYRKKDSIFLLSLQISQ